MICTVINNSAVIDVHELITCGYNKGPVELRKEESMWLITHFYRSMCFTSYLAASKFVVWDPVNWPTKALWAAHDILEKQAKSCSHSGPQNPKDLVNYLLQAAIRSVIVTSIAGPLQIIHLHWMKDQGWVNTSITSINIIMIFLFIISIIEILGHQRKDHFHVKKES